MFTSQVRSTLNYLKKYRFHKTFQVNNKKNHIPFYRFKSDHNLLDCFSKCTNNYFPTWYFMDVQR